MNKKDFYSKYMHDGQCWPHEAACLIRSTDPEENVPYEDGMCLDQYNNPIAYLTMHDEDL